MEKIYILLPVHNRREITRRFVECLKIQTYQNFHLVLIDDGSSDGTAEMVQDEISSLTVLKGKGDWWWAGSLQQGYGWLQKQQVSPTDVVLIANDDTQFEKDFLEKGVALLRRNKQSLVLAQLHNKMTGHLHDTGVYVDWRNLRFEQPSSPELINCLSTRGLFLRASDFFDSGGFHPRLLRHYLSDYEFTIRSLRCGKALLTDPSLKLWGDIQATGYHSTDYSSVREFWRKHFSKKSAANPFAWTAFILLACPCHWKLKHLARIWISSAILLLKAAVR